LKEKKSKGVKPTGWALVHWRVTAGEGNQGAIMKKTNNPRTPRVPDGSTKIMEKNVPNKHHRNKERKKSWLEVENSGGS